MAITQQFQRMDNLGEINVDVDIDVDVYVDHVVNEFRVDFCL